MISGQNFSEAVTIFSGYKNFSITKKSLCLGVIVGSSMGVRVVIISAYINSVPGAERVVMHYITVYINKLFRERELVFEDYT